MAAMSTVLTEFSDKENVRTWTAAGHLVSKPKLVIQKRRIGSVNATSAQDIVSVVCGAADAAGASLAQKVVFDVTIRRPIAAVTADVNSARDIFKDIVASDEFLALITTQNYIKA